MVADNARMKDVIQPLQLLLVSVAGWMSRRQQEVIEYLVEANRVLKEQLGDRRLRLTDDQRRRLAARGKLIGLMRATKALIVRMATENSSRGDCRIQGEQKGLGHTVAPTTIANVLKANGIKPAPDRPSSWRTFLKAHWGQIAATEFFSAEVWTPRGLTTYYVLFMVDLKTRRARLAGITTNPDEAFMAQIARNLTDAFDGLLNGHRFLILDRDGKFTPGIKRALTDAGTSFILTPPQAPHCNAYADRFVLSIKSECLNRMMLFGRSDCAGPSRASLSTTTSSGCTRGSGTRSSTANQALVVVMSSAASGLAVSSSTTTELLDGRGGAAFGRGPRLLTGNTTDRRGTRCHACAASLPTPGADHRHRNPRDASSRPSPHGRCLRDRPCTTATASGLARPTMCTGYPRATQPEPSAPGLRPAPRPPAPRWPTHARPAWDRSQPPGTP